MTALVIEDEPLVLGVFQMVLQMHGFTVFPAATADDAIRLCSDRQLQMDVVIVDRRLPDALGIDVALQVRACRPDVSVILTSGTPKDNWETTEIRCLSALPKDCFAFLQKPFTFQTLTDIVDELLGRRAVVKMTTAP